MKIQIKHFPVIAPSIVVLISILLCTIGCEWLGQRFLGGPPLSECRVKARYAHDKDKHKVSFEVLSKDKFGNGPMDEIHCFLVEKDTGTGFGNVWSLRAIIFGISRRIEIITYSINPAPDLFDETVSPEPLEMGILYRAGYITYTYFKLVKDPQKGFIILQGKSPDHLRKEK